MFGERFTGHLTTGCPVVYGKRREHFSRRFSLRGRKSVTRQRLYAAGWYDFVIRPNSLVRDREFRVRSKKPLFGSHPEHNSPKLSLSLVHRWRVVNRFLGQIPVERAPVIRPTFNSRSTLFVAD